MIEIEGTDKFHEKYKLIKNPRLVSEYSSRGLDAGSPDYLEELSRFYWENDTDRKNINEVRFNNIHNLWTCCFDEGISEFQDDNDDSKPVVIEEESYSISNGFHYINREYYYISEQNGNDEMYWEKLDKD